MDFGKFMKEKRLEKGLKQETLAIAINKTNQYISNIENGKNNAPPDECDIETLINVLKLNDKEASIFRTKAAGCRNSLPKKQMDYIYANSSLLELIEFGNKNGISDEKWKNILEHIVNDRQEQE